MRSAGVASRQVATGIWTYHHPELRVLLEEMVHFVQPFLCECLGLAVICHHIRLHGEAGRVRAIIRRAGSQRSYRAS